jgi:hypothetical protein
VVVVDEVVSRDWNWPSGCHNGESGPTYMACPRLLAVPGTRSNAAGSIRVNEICQPGGHNSECRLESHRKRRCFMVSRRSPTGRHPGHLAAFARGMILESRNPVSVYSKRSSKWWTASGSWPIPRSQHLAAEMAVPRATLHPDE